MNDFIIVGAGSAGCVLAGRLSEDPSCRVLLLEAGPPNHQPEIHVPAAFPLLFKGPLDWRYDTDEEEQMAGRRLYWPRGKVLGGCSSMNAMIYIRGHRSDYDTWSEMGASGWSYAEVLPWFKRAEYQCRGPSAYHGLGGPLHVSDPRSPNPLSAMFLEACAEAGIPRNDDFNGATQEGAGFYQLTQKRGARWSAADAYLKQARKRPNLHVVTSAQATRVLFTGTRAIGIEYLHNGALHSANAGEVILSGGAVNSPQLLLLSGIGPAAQLREMGIPVVVDLPGVGQNLQDHLLTGVSCACSRKCTLDDAGTFLDILRYALLRRGRLTSNVGEAGAFVRSDPAVPIPDLQFYFAPVYYVRHGFDRPGGAGFSIGVCALRSKSRGEIRLRSTDPEASPIIRPRYFTDASDLHLQLAGLKLARRLSQSSAFAKVRGPEYVPGAAVQSDEELIRFIREQTETLYHPVGTCKMGRDSLAVVDPSLRVHGTTGLRVVDASIMPTLIGGNTHAPTVMIAEKASGLIRCVSLPREESA